LNKYFPQETQNIERGDEMIALFYGLREFPKVIANYVPQKVDLFYFFLPSGIFFSLNFGHLKKLFSMYQMGKKA